MKEFVLEAVAASVVDLVGIDNAMCMLIDNFLILQVLCGRQVFPKKQHDSVSDGL